MVSVAKYSWQEKEKRKIPPTAPAAIIPLTILQPVLSWPGVSSGTTGWATALRFNRDPEHGLSPHSQIHFTTIFLTLFEKKGKKKELIQKATSEQQQLPPDLISHLRHNGKTRPLWTGLFKDSWKRGAVNMTTMAPTLLCFKMVIIEPT